MGVITIIFHVISFFLGILLIYYSILLLKELSSEDFVVSMIFLHEKEIMRIFLVIVLGALIFLIGQVYYSLFTNPDISILKLTAILYSISLLYFVYELQHVLRNGGGK